MSICCSLNFGDLFNLNVMKIGMKKEFPYIFFLL